MAQKMMLKKTKAAGKYAVCATEMLASMEAGWVQKPCSQPLKQLSSRVFLEVLWCPFAIVQFASFSAFAPIDTATIPRSKIFSYQERFNPKLRNHRSSLAS